MAAEFILVGIVMFVIGLFIKNKKLKKIFVYTGLVLALVILVVFFDEIKSQTMDAFNEGRDAAVGN